MLQHATALAMAKQKVGTLVQVDREKKRAAAAAAREKREQAANSWFGWLRGATKPTVRHASSACFSQAMTHCMLVVQSDLSCTVNSWFSWCH